MGESTSGGHRRHAVSDGHRTREDPASSHSRPGRDHPAYLEAERPVIPPTFLTTTFFWQTGDADPWPAVQLDQQRGLHAEQEFTFFGPPPRAGTRLTCQSRITDVYTKTGRRGGELTFAVMVTEFRDETGRLVAQATLTGVETARPPKEAA